ncbi:MAG: ParB/RepB/Spo0J family partition protein [Pirellula sp.]|jgi:ParB-like chromosome segregation protein Spo0J
MVGNGANKTSTNKHQYPIHEAAAIFPMMGDREFADFKKDIETYGVKEWGTLYRGQVLDGRNRYKACQELGIEMTFCEIEDDDKFDPVAYVLSHNLHRRHLTESQRAMVAAKVATMKQGARTDLRSIEPKSNEDAASQMKVSPASVKRAKNVIAKGAVEVQQAVEQGSLPVSVASELVKAVPDKDQQTEIVSKGTDAVRQAVKEKPLAQKRLTKQQAAEKRKQASAGPSAGLDDLRKAWLQATEQARKEFLKEVQHEQAY